jgi:hypothetical protein
MCRHCVILIFDGRWMISEDHQVQTRKPAWVARRPRLFFDELTDGVANCPAGVKLDPEIDRVGRSSRSIPAKVESIDGSLQC